MTIRIPESLRMLLPNGQIAEMELDAYLAGVVFCQMGVSTPIEALKAQAVASRTYASAAQRHAQVKADVCSTAHCQKWKRADPALVPEVWRAVRQTEGLVATYQGNLIDAFFFEHCDGQTRGASELLVHAVPYLQSVGCECGFVQRQGHGVGLCQRGAIVMARRGASFERILKHYYRGIDVADMGPRLRAKAMQVEASVAAENGPAAEPAAAVEPKAVAALSGEVAHEPVLGSGMAVPDISSVDAQVERTHSEEAIQPISGLVHSDGAGEVAKPVSMDEKSKAIVDTDKPSGSGRDIEIESTQAATRDAASSRTEPTESPWHQEPVQAEPPAAVLREERLAAHVEPPKVQAEHQSWTDKETLTVEAPAQSSDLENADVPAYVASLNRAAALSAEEIIAASRLEARHDMPEQHESVLKSKERMHVDHLPGPRMIAGCLAAAGIAITVKDAEGNEIQVVSGSAPHYGEGGFEVFVEEDGLYWLSIQSEGTRVKVDRDTVFIHSG